MNLYPLSPVAPRSFGDANVDALHVALRAADHRWREAELNNVPHDTLRQMVQLYIDASYAFQRARWGRVTVRLSVAGVLR